MKQLEGLFFHILKRSSKFVLIGNNIDGLVTSGITEFKDFEEVKKGLKTEIESINFFGEWDLKFYEVPDDYNIIIKHEYYKVPSKGNLLFEMNYYNNIGNILKLFIDDSMIHFHFLTEYIQFHDQAETDEEYINVDVTEDFLTIFLFSREVEKRTNPEAYRMDESSYLARRDASSFHELGNSII